LTTFLIKEKILNKHYKRSVFISKYPVPFSTLKKKAFKSYGFAVHLIVCATSNLGWIGTESSEVVCNQEENKGAASSQVHRLRPPMGSPVRRQRELRMCWNVPVTVACHPFASIPREHANIPSDLDPQDQCVRTNPCFLLWNLDPSFLRKKTKR